MGIHDPKLIIFTSVEEPRGVYYASETAAPLFQAVLNAAVTRYSLPATEQKSAPPVLAEKVRKTTGQETSSVENKNTEATVADVSTPVRTAPMAIHWEGKASDGSFLWKMPSLTGLTPREAFQALSGHKFQFEVLGTGLIRNQVPEEGKIVADGSRIRVQLAEP